MVKPGSRYLVAICPLCRMAFGMEAGVTKTTCPRCLRGFPATMARKVSGCDHPAELARVVSAVNSELKGGDGDERFRPGGLVTGDGPEVTGGKDEGDGPEVTGGKDEGDGREVTGGKDEGDGPEVTGGKDEGDCQEGMGNVETVAGTYEGGEDENGHGGAGSRNDRCSFAGGAGGDAGGAIDDAYRPGGGTPCGRDDRAAVDGALARAVRAGSGKGGGQARARAVARALGELPGGFTGEQFIRAAAGARLPGEHERLLGKLLEEGEIFSPSPGRYRWVGGA